MRGTLAGSLVVAVVALSCAGETEIQQEPAGGGGETGEVWTGTMHTETRLTGAPDSTMPGITYSCEGSLDTTTLRFVVADDGTVSGEASFTEPETVCRGGGVQTSSPAESGTFSVSGTKSATEFRLIFFLVEGHIGSYLPVNVLVEGVPIPISGPARAEREFRVELPSGPATITSDFAFELTCESCEEAVG